jgi:hypothetical protein
MEELNIIRLEVLVQRKKVEDKCKKLQALVDNKLEDTTYMWCRDYEYMLFTGDIFWKKKKQREEDVIK